MLVSIIIPTVDNIFYLKKILSCLFDNVTVNTQIILVDDASNLPETLEYYKTLDDKNIEFIFNTENLGYVKSINKGIKLAKGDFILILNDDVLIPPQAIENMINHLLANPSIGIISAFSNNREYLIKERNIYLNYDAKIERDFFDWAKNYQNENYKNLVYWYKLEGYCMLFRKEFYEKIKLENGIFDEIFEIGNFEDTDLCKRAVRAGYKLAIAMDAYVHHFTHTTFKRKAKEFLDLLEKNEKVFRKKWDKKQTITAMILIKDENNISKILSHVSEYVDSIALLDTTNTISQTEIEKIYPKVKKIHKNPINLQQDEKRDRNILLQLAKELNPDWFICLDSNEVFEDKIKDEIQIICNPHSDLINQYMFPIYYFWNDEKHYRIDGKFKDKKELKLFRNTPEFTSFENLKLDFSLDLNNLRVKNYFYYNNKISTNEENLELLKWEENKKKNVELSIAIFVTEENLKNFDKTLKEFENNSKDFYMFDIENPKFKELIILDTTNKIKDVNIENKEIKIIFEHNINFEQAQNLLINNFSKDYLLILKSGEILDYENYLKIIKYINNTDYGLANVLITYFDSIIPYPSFFECRLIKKGQEVTFINNSSLLNVPKFTPIDLPIAKIFNINDIAKEKFLNFYISENVEHSLEYNKKKPNDIDNLYYLGASLTLNREFDSSIQIFEKYISIVRNFKLDKDVYLGLVFNAINYYQLNKFDTACIKLYEALQLNINSYFADILFIIIYLKMHKKDKVIHHLEKCINNNFKLNKTEKYLEEIQKNWLQDVKTKMSEIKESNNVFPKGTFFNIKNKPIITAMLAIKNEEKYIHRTLSHLSEYVDSIAILDDASTDSTLEIVKTFPKVKKLHINPPNIGRHEGRDRNILFKLAKELNPDWFICLDGDEIFEDRIKDKIYNLCENEYIEGYLFKMFHFWRGEKFYRVDKIWKDQLRFKMLRNRDIYYELETKDMKLHAQTVPKNLERYKVIYSNIRVKHYGYADFDGAVKKYNFYEKEDKIKDATQIGAKDYYHLIDESTLQLEEWKENIF